MNAQERQEVAALRREIAALWRIVSALPARFAGGGKPTLITIQVIGGNVLSSGTQGVKSVSSKTSASANYDPASDTSMEDGIGYGYLIQNGVLSSTKVLIVNDGAGVSSDAFPLIVGDRFISSGPISIPVGSGPSAISAYTVG